jgi:hypothetical protein
LLEQKSVRFADCRPLRGQLPPTIEKHKGEMMKRQYLRILVAVLGFAALGATVKANEIDQVVVTIPFQFVAAGKTLPAGTYRLNRVSGERFQGLFLSSFENRVGTIVMPIEVESVAAETPQLTFEQVGDQHILSKIQTGDNVFNLRVPPAATLLASAPSHAGKASGSLGND